MNLEEHIAEIRSGIKAGRFASEASVSQGIVLRLLHALGWPAYDTQVIVPQYSLEGRRVDYALCHPASKPVAFIEVKQLGQSEGAERQLFEYAFHQGIPLAILTDGQEWNFFLPAEQGDYGERRVYKLDIVEREIAECVHRLNRYLKHDAVASGAAMVDARSDYLNVSRERQIKNTLPQAWARLIEEEDELLLELVADRVEILCGFKPDPDTVAAFLRAHPFPTSVTSAVQFPTNAPPRSREPTSTVVPPKDQGSHQAPGIGFVINGQFHPARNAVDAMNGIFEAFAKRDPSFPERFASLPKHGRTRRYLAKSRDELYPGRPDLVHHSKRLSSGWWLGTNYSKGLIAQIIEMACNVMRLRYGKDVRVELGE